MLLCLLLLSWLKVNVQIPDVYVSWQWKSISYPGSTSNYGVGQKRYSLAWTSKRDVNILRLENIFIFTFKTTLCTP